MIDFRIIRDMSSMNLTGYIEFLLMITVSKSAYGEIIERMYREIQEYLMNIPLNISGGEVIMALFFCLNIPTIDQQVLSLNNILLLRSRSSCSGLCSVVISSGSQDWLNCMLCLR
jgi:hypothetical protein